MGSSRRSRVLVAASAAAVVALTVPGLASAAPQARSTAAPHVHHGRGDRDARPGGRAPSDGQRTLAAGDHLRSRWNRFGTAERLVSEAGGALAKGLPADPEQAARAYLEQHRDVLGVSADAVRSLQLVSVNKIGSGAAVLLRERFGDLPAGYDGLVSVGVADGAAYSVTSSLARDVSAPAAATLSPDDAVAAAAEDAGLSAGTVTARGHDNGWQRLSVSGLDGVQSVKQVAVPMPDGGARAAYEVALADDNERDPQSYTSYVDARNGQVLVREDTLVDETDDPEWKAFLANPPADYSSRDTRATLCWTPTPGCDLAVANASSPVPWDVDPALGDAPSDTTRGNNEYAAENWNDPTGRAFSADFATPSPNRSYTYPWTNQWFEQRCDPNVFDTPQRNDIDAADASLLVTHNRMHDFAYKLGFTESAWNLQDDNFGKGGLGSDPELGNAQSGARVTSTLIRDNANQRTGPDGTPPMTNMYLWQSIAGSFYSPCVDGDYDVSVIGHEYTHAISNRMVAGPDRGLSGAQAGAMGESWSDLDAMEYLNAYGLVPRGQKPYVTGQYVTGNAERGIRDYDLSRNPLNYSDVGFDLTGPEVHADGEIWNAVNFDVRQAFVDRYGAGSPALRRSCADGATPVARCPGDRRWIQLVYDAWLLMAQGSVSMLDARDAMLAADQIRFGGANQALIWNAFARRGFGVDASSNGTNDSDPTPSFASPFAHNGSVRFVPSGDASGIQDMRVFVGDYQARAVPVADTDPSTAPTDVAGMVPGTYRFVAQAPGFGAERFTVRVRPGQQAVHVGMDRNLASASSGASASGDGVDLAGLIDDDEGTTWAYLGDAGTPVAGRHVTVRLGGDGPQRVSRVQVSALLRPADAQDPGGDKAAQNRFTALRSFQVLACTASASVSCADDADYRVVYTSAKNAFPSEIPRPVAPTLTMRSFQIEPTTATHLQLRVVASQCTGNPQYAGQQTNDPRVPTDCTTGSTVSGQVRAAEFQAFRD